MNAELTPGVVADLMAAINLSWDPEEGHGAEDDLALTVLRAIAAGAPHAPALAQAYLDGYDTEATRWYA